MSLRFGVGGCLICATADRTAARDFIEIAERADAALLHLEAFFVLNQAQRRVAFDDGGSPALGRDDLAGSVVGERVQFAQDRRLAPHPLAVRLETGNEVRSRRHGPNEAHSRACWWSSMVN